MCRFSMHRAIFLYNYCGRMSSLRNSCTNSTQSEIPLIGDEPFIHDDNPNLAKRINSNQNIGASIFALESVRTEHFFEVIFG